MAKLTDGGGRPHSGQVQYPVVAIVKDNVDPDELGRIMVTFPTLHEEPASFWLRQASPNGGKERGFYALPEIGDEVLVIFLQGSHDVGVIIGQFWNGVDIPPQECKDALPGSGATDTGATWSTDVFTDGTTDLEKNDRRFWKSRSGHLFVFDDSDSAETIQVWDGSHKLAFVFDTQKAAIYLTNTEGDIHIRTKNDLYLEAGNDIKVYAGNNIDGECGNNCTITVGVNYTLDVGANIEVSAGANATYEASANFTAKGSANATFEAGAMATFKGGATATLEGGASTTVKGAVVMIN